MSVPDILWAQDKENVHITIQQTNCSDVNIELKEESINLKFFSKVNYECVMELGGKIDLENSKWENNRNIKFTLKRLENQYWPNLLKNKNFKNKIKTDWSRWIDEDESDEDDNGVPGGMDMASMMQNMGGMEGLQNMMGGGGMEGLQNMMGGGGMEGLQNMMGGGGMEGLQNMTDDNSDDSTNEDSNNVSDILNDLEKKDCCNDNLCSENVDCKVKENTTEECSVIN